jgi:hypothetical protein
MNTCLRNQFRRLYLFINGELNTDKALSRHQYSFDSFKSPSLLGEGDLALQTIALAKETAYRAGSEFMRSRRITLHSVV